MITRIEIDGFKSFNQFALNLRPFQVIIGANGVGKSNLFDAIEILSHLANGESLFDSFQASRGNITEQFALLDNGERGTKIQFAVEVLLPQTIQGNDNLQGFISQTRLRYEIHISRHEKSVQGLYIDYETLIPVKDKNDTWAQDESQRLWINNFHYHPIITTEEGDFVLHEGDLFGRTKFPRQNAQISTLSLAANINPLVSGMTHIMKQWQNLQFDPHHLRQPSSPYARKDTLLPNGSNLPTLLYAMKQEDEFVLSDIARDMMALNQNFKSLHVEYDTFRDEVSFYVEDLNGNKLSPKVLSDGTLRTLAFVTLRNNLNYQGVLCIEEPENGVHPFVLEKLLDMLKSMVTNFNDTNTPLRQIIINTHSPILLNYVNEQDIAYMYMPRNNPRFSAISTVTASLDKADEAKYVFTKHQISNFLRLASKPEHNHA